MEVVLQKKKTTRKEKSITENYKRVDVNQTRNNVIFHKVIFKGYLLLILFPYLWILKELFIFVFFSSCFYLFALNLTTKKTLLCV